MHHHDYDEIIIIEQGHSRVVLNDSVRDATAGDILVIKAGTPHGFVNIGPDVLKQVDIHLNPRFEQHNLPPTQVARQVGLPL